MKRILSALILPLLLVSELCLPAGAKKTPISLQYVPPTQRGTLFYLEVYADTDIAAAVFELHSDPTAEYRSAACDDDRASVEAVEEGSAVKIAYSNRSSASGRLFRLAFKAQSSSGVRFTLHTSQAVDGELRYLTDIPDVVLEIRPETADSDSGAAQSQKKLSDSQSSDKKSYGGSRSEKSDSGKSSDDDEDDDKDNSDKGLVLRNLSSRSYTLPYSILGVASIVLPILMITFAYVIERRRRKKEAKKEEEEE